MLCHKENFAHVQGMFVWAFGQCIPVFLGYLKWFSRVCQTKCLEELTDQPYCTKQTSAKWCVSKPNLFMRRALSAIKNITLLWFWESQIYSHVGFNYFSKWQIFLSSLIPFAIAMCGSSNHGRRSTSKNPKRCICTISRNLQPKTLLKPVSNPTA